MPKDFCDFCAKQLNIVYKEGVVDAEYENVHGVESDGNQLCDGCGHHFEAGEDFLRATVISGKQK